MGFFRKMLGYKSESSSGNYNAANYSTQTTVPTINTNTTVAKEEDAKEAEKPDTSEYDESMKRRKKKNGVSGSFGFSEEKDPIGA